MGESRNDWQRAICKPKMSVWCKYVEIFELFLWALRLFGERLGNELLVSHLNNCMEEIGLFLFTSPAHTVSYGSCLNGHEW